MYDVPLEKWKFADSVILDIPQNAQWWTYNIEPPQRGYLEHFLKDVDKELPQQNDGEIIDDKDVLIEKIKDEKISRKLLDNSKRKRPGTKKGLRSFEQR